MSKYRWIRILLGLVCLLSGGIYALQQGAPAPKIEKAEGGDAPSAYFAAENMSQSAETAGPLDLNRATKEELMRLPGIGEVKAERILRYREEHDRFETIEELMQISGIKQKTFDGLRDFVTVGELS